MAHEGKVTFEHWDFGAECDQQVSDLLVELASQALRCGLKDEPWPSIEYEKAPERQIVKLVAEYVANTIDSELEEMTEASFTEDGVVVRWLIDEIEEQVVTVLVPWKDALFMSDNLLELAALFRRIADDLENTSQ